jgi:hypothetical protein
MADEITINNLAGEYAYDYRLLAESIVAALYDSLELRGFTTMKSLSGFASNAERFPVTPTLSAGALTEGTDLTANTAFAPTAVTLTIGEVGLKVTITDLMMMGGIVQATHYGEEMGKAVAEKRTSDIVALGAGFSNSVGATTVDITEQNYLDAIAQLRGAKVPRPYVGVLHSDSYYKEFIKAVGGTFTALTTQGGSVRGESNDLPGAGDNGVVGNVYGTTLLVTPLVGEDGNSDKENFMYNPGALGFVEKWGIRVEADRKPSMRGTEFVTTSAYATGEISDIRGVRIISDGA